MKQNKTFEAKGVVKVVAVSQSEARFDISLQRNQRHQTVKAVEREINNISCA